MDKTYQLTERERLYGYDTRVTFDTFEDALEHLNMLITSGVEIDLDVEYEPQWGYYYIMPTDMDLWLKEVCD